MMLWAALLSLFLQAGPPGPATKASVAGVVVNSSTGDPVPNVQVSLARMNVPLGAFAQLIRTESLRREVTFSREELETVAQLYKDSVEKGDASLTGGAVALQSLPLDDIQEITVSPSGDTAVILKSTPPVLSDAAGRFSFTGLEPGAYRLTFSVAGFARQSYGQRTPTGAGVPLTLATGQAKADIVMGLSPLGAISGRIRNDAGEPGIGVPVQLLRFSYDAAGQKQIQRVAGTLTDDLGNYRMYSIPAGRYFLGAGNPSGNTGATGLTDLQTLSAGGSYSSPNRINSSYAPVYFPTVTDESRAAVIDVPSGGELNGMDMVVTPQRSYSIRGRVVDLRTTQPVDRVDVSAISQSMLTQAQSSLSRATMSANSFSGGNGSFAIQNVSAGAYLLYTQVQRPPEPDRSGLSPAEKSASLDAAASAYAALPRGTTIVHVVNADLNDVVLSLSARGVIQGQVRVESNPANLPAQPGLVRVQLRPLGASSSYTTVNLPSFQQLQTPGAFQIYNVLPGEYQFSVNGLPAGFYVKEAHLGNVDVLNTPLRYGGPDTARLDVVLSPRVGEVRGVALDASGRPAPGAVVVLIPNTSRDRAELFRTAAADSSGTFKIDSIAPGEYTLAAWEALEPFGFFDPSVIRQAEDHGKAIRVAESSTQTVSVTSQ